MDEFDYIDPYRQFYGCLVPNWLMEQRAVGPVAKLCYGELAWQSRRHGGVAKVSLDELAERIGGTKSTTQRALKELEGLRLIETTRMGLNQANEYRFLDHPWIRRRAAAEATGGAAGPVGNRSGQYDHSRSDGPARSGQNDQSGVVNMTTPSIGLQVKSNSPLPPTPAEGSGEAVEGAGSFTLRQARELTAAWFARQPTPPVSIGRETLARRVHKLVAAGWPDGLVEDALDLCENFTEAAIEGRLRGLRATSYRPMGFAGNVGQLGGQCGDSGRRPERPDCDVCGGSGWALDDDDRAIPCPHPSDTEEIA